MTPFENLESRSLRADEAERIRSEYARREAQLPKDQYSLGKQHNLFAYQQKNRLLLNLLAHEGLTPLDGKRILDVGCGEGQQLLDLVSWGARRADLAGIDLIHTRIARAHARIGGGRDAGESGPDLRVGDASRLPWPEASFDIVHQNTVFTSIIDHEMKRNVAREILRVLKPGGALIWYDFLYDNPRNAAVRGIGAREIRALFSGCHVRLRRVTLAPPIARRLVPLSWVVSLLLETLVVLNTHYLAIIRKPDGLQVEGQT
jgi:ubiquinone/menaquinone biosynthesis C-methylase UbiE